MTSTGIVSSGIERGPEAVVAGTENVPDSIALLHRPADAELTLRSMEVYLPVEPVSINGTLYSVVVDQDKLITAINIIAEPPEGLHKLYPRQLVVEAGGGESTVEIGEGLRPKITHRSGGNKPILTTLEDGRTSLNITVPRDLRSTKYADEGLVQIVTQKANKDLWVALSQNLEAQTMIVPGVRNIMTGLVVLAGDSVGNLAAEGRSQMFLYGIIGAVLGAGMVRSGFVAMDGIRWGAKKNQAAWSVRQARNYRLESYRDDSAIDSRLAELVKGSPVISLQPVEAESEEE